MRTLALKLSAKRKNSGCELSWLILGSEIIHALDPTLGV
jgi:hypothetical protein